MMYNKKGQAAIEFLMTYGWMLLVVLIVGALIFSFVDFGSLLPSKLDLNNNLRGMPSDSVAQVDKVTAVFSYIGTRQVVINASHSNSAVKNNALNINCTLFNVTNVDTEASSSIEASTDNVTNFLNGHTGIAYFNCSDDGLVSGDVLEGTITIMVMNPLTEIETPSTGSLRLNIQ